MEFVSSSIPTRFPDIFDSLPSKQRVFEAVVVRDYRILVALIVSFVCSAVLIVFDMQYWWTYEKRRQHITLLPAQTQRQDQGCGCGEDYLAQQAPTRQRPGEDETIEQIFLASPPTAVHTPPSSNRSSRRRRPHHPYAVHSLSADKTWGDPHR